MVLSTRSVPRQVLDSFEPIGVLRTIRPADTLHRIQRWNRADVDVSGLNAQALDGLDGAARRACVDEVVDDATPDVTHREAARQGPVGMRNRALVHVHPRSERHAWIPVTKPSASERPPPLCVSTQRKNPILQDAEALHSPSTRPLRHFLFLHHPHSPLRRSGSAHTPS